MKVAASASSVQFNEALLTLSLLIFTIKQKRQGEDCRNESFAAFFALATWFSIFKRVVVSLKASLD